MTTLDQVRKYITFERSIPSLDISFRILQKLILVGQHLSCHHSSEKSKETE